MFRKALPFFIHTITPLHAGSGDSLGVVDMPIQRERHTGFPKIEGSSLKGSIREVFRELIDNENKITEKKIEITFGPEKGDDYAGSLGFTDARILLFPVKSVQGVFAWITCPAVIKRFKNDLGVSKNNTNGIPDVCVKTEKEKSYCISSSNDIVINKNVILEEYAFKVVENDDEQNEYCSKLAKLLAGKLGMDEIKNKLVILSNDDFTDFVKLSTEVITRTKIDPDTGTVVGGALFTEEYLPAETIMYSLALTSPPFSKDKSIFKNETDVMNFFTTGIPNIIQIGGNATIGKGIVNIIKYKGGTQ